MGFNKKSLAAFGMAFAVGAAGLLVFQSHAKAQDAMEEAPYSDEELDAEINMAEEAMNSKEDFSAKGGHDVSKVMRSGSKRYSRAEAFLAGPSWEFDGFVSGGQDSKIKSMFYLNDLVYLNIGASQGVQPGDDLSIFRRGQKVQDPQNGDFIGYEVRRTAVARVTDQVNDETAVARIIKTYEAVEIGDIVRRQ